MIKRFDKKGFILMETIIVMGVLCITMIALYGGYHSILLNIMSKTHYDNTEYLYKVNSIKFELNDELLSLAESTTTYSIFCSNDRTGIENGINGACTNYAFLSDLKVQSIYVMTQASMYGWQYKNDVLATTQKYIKSLDLEGESGKWLVVMFDDENSDERDNIYEYASLILN